MEFSPLPNRNLISENLLTEEKPKKRKLKIIMGISLGIILIVLAINYYNYSTNITEEETTTEEETIIEETPKTNIMLIEETQGNPPINLEGANPRMKFWYQGSEVAYIDHLGNILSTGNITSDSWCNSTGTCWTLTTLNITLTEDEIEAYIFDDDNTANFNLNNYNITGINYTHYKGGGYIYSNGTALILGHS